MVRAFAYSPTTLKFGRNSSATIASIFRSGETIFFCVEVLSIVRCYFLRRRWRANYGGPCRLQWRFENAYCWQYFYERERRIHYIFSQCCPSPSHAHLPLEIFLFESLGTPITELVCRL